jgi:hypothetical protein
LRLFSRSRAHLWSGCICMKDFIVHLYFVPFALMASVHRGALSTNPDFARPRRALTPALPKTGPYICASYVHAQLGTRACRCIAHVSSGLLCAFSATAIAANLGCRMTAPRGAVLYILSSLLRPRSLITEWDHEGPGLLDGVVISTTPQVEGPSVTKKMAPCHGVRFQREPRRHSTSKGSLSMGLGHA